MHCFYHPGYYFPLPESHPFPMDKFWRSEAMVRDAVGDRVQIEAVEPISEAALLRVHTAEYLRKIRSGNLEHTEALKLGLPASEALLVRSRLEVAGTVAAAWAALEDGLACNLAGGTHHAFPDRGLGYCVLNDVAIAIRELQQRLPALRIAVVDTDAHQGNGTNGIFSNDERVFTYSIHVGKNYPALKTPGALDVELPRYVHGADYLEQLESTLAAALDDFRPEFIFWIAGADPHENDRFGQMKLSDADMHSRDRHVLDVVTKRRIPIAVLYGGGYNRERTHTARLHANTVVLAAEYAERFHTRCNNPEQDIRMEGSRPHGTVGRGCFRGAKFSDVCGPRGRGPSTKCGPRAGRLPPIAYRLSPHASNSSMLTD